MTIQSKKVCLLGDLAVGKTSAVIRAVRNTFSKAYRTTVGAKVESNMAAFDSQPVRLVLWDIAGGRALDPVRTSYMLGASGLLIVADGTRENTVSTALELGEQASRLLGRDLPRVLALNKSDLADEWEVSPSRLRELQERLPVFSVSAKTGEGVHEAFYALWKAMPS
ncbi:Rab family GTPase [Lysobacter capsici]|uniref:Rab family GTPase n=1 Tax=Lysobacter capsici TaxID=435897 RepID=UPI0007165436|nr:Rab family GTPase [Lysobacter capsici]